MAYEGIKCRRCRSCFADLQEDDASLVAYYGRLAKLKEPSLLEERQGNLCPKCLARDVWQFPHIQSSAQLRRI